MTWPMAKSQMVTSKKPTMGARSFLPRDKKMMRSVNSVTTLNSAKKTRIGKAAKLGNRLLGTGGIFILSNEDVQMATNIGSTGARGRVHTPSQLGVQAQIARVRGWQGRCCR